MRQRGRRIRRPTAQSGLRSASRRAVPPALCLLALGRLENPVHGTGGLVYGMGCPIGSGMTMRGRRTRIRQFGVRGGENDGCRTRNGRFGVRGGEKEGRRTRIRRFGVRDRERWMPYTDRAIWCTGWAEGMGKKNPGGE